jgi:RNA polymerase sigma-70 factor (ECF subfamily)
VSEEARANFPATRLSAFEMLRSASPADRSLGLDRIAGAYWRAIYAHVRLKWRKGVDEGRELTQAFFAEALERRTFDAYDPARGRFRTFLRTCLDRFLANDHAARKALKRGGGATPLDLDFDAIEPEIEALASRPEDPDQAFDREWMSSILASAVAELELECERRGKSRQYRVFESYVLCDDDERPTYAALAKTFGITPSDVSNDLFFTRRELKRLVLARLSDVTATEQELQEEMRLVLGR